MAVSSVLSHVGSNNLTGKLQHEVIILHSVLSLHQCGTHVYGGLRHAFERSVGRYLAQSLLQASVWKEEVRATAFVRQQHSRWLDARLEEVDTIGSQTCRDVAEQSLLHTQQEHS